METIVTRKKAVKKPSTSKPAKGGRGISAQPDKIHIIISIDKKKWQVVPARRRASIKNFPKKEDAIAFVRTSKKAGSQIIVHTEQGEVERRIN